MMRHDNDTAIDTEAVREQ